MLAPVLVTPADGAVVSLDEAKLHMRVDSDEDDALITSLVQSATEHVERTLDLALLQQDWRQDFPGFGDRLRLPLRPVDTSTIVVTYRDADDAQQTLATSVYRVATDATGTYVRLASGESWPSTYDRDDAVSIEFTAGYGDAASVPAALKVAILLHVAFLYERRENHADVTIAPTGAYDMLVWPYRRPKV